MSDHPNSAASMAPVMVLVDSAEPHKSVLHEVPFWRACLVARGKWMGVRTTPATCTCCLLHLSCSTPGSTWWPLAEPRWSCAGDMLGFGLT